MRLTEEEAGFLLKRLIANDLKLCVPRIKRGKYYHITLVLLTVSEYAGQKAVGLSVYALNKFSNKLQANKYRKSLFVEVKNNEYVLNVSKLPESVAKEMQAPIIQEMLKYSVHNGLEQLFIKH